LSAMSSKKKGLVKKEHPKLKYSDPLLVCIFGGFYFVELEGSGYFL
jgi:hypothetical protein